MFYEVGCERCQDIMREVIKPAIAKYDPDIMTIELHPWGNAYYPSYKCADAPTQAGRYSPVARECWGKYCGRGVESKASDCFTGKIICQHDKITKLAGHPECSLNKYVACAKKVTVGDFTKYAPFAACVDEQWDDMLAAGFPAGTSPLLAEDCASKSSLDFAALKACFEGPDGDQAVQEEAAATPAHRLVPFLLVDGVKVHPIDAQGGIDWGALPDALQLTSRRLQKVQV